MNCPQKMTDWPWAEGGAYRQAGQPEKKVDIIRYVTEGMFDAYLYQIIENKQKFISQIMTSNIVGGREVWYAKWRTAVLMNRVKMADG